MPLPAFQYGLKYPGANCMRPPVPAAGPKPPMPAGPDGVSNAGMLPPNVNPGPPPVNPEPPPPSPGPGIPPPANPNPAPGIPPLANPPPPVKPPLNPPNPPPWKGVSGVPVTLGGTSDEGVELGVGTAPPPPGAGAPGGGMLLGATGTLGGGGDVEAGGLGEGPCGSGGRSIFGTMVFAGDIGIAPGPVVGVSVVFAPPNP